MIGNLPTQICVEPFLKAVVQAKHYGLYDINRLETIILQFVTNEFFQLGERDI